MAEKDNSVFTIGFFIGALAGVAIGFMYAPTSGKETRARLKEKAGEIKEIASERIEKTREAVTEAGKKVREKLDSQE